MRTSHTQIRNFLTLALIVPALLVLWYPHAAQAEALTNAELANLYVALGIIPRDHQTEALAAAEAGNDTLAMKMYVELLIELGIVPTEKAEEARDILAQVNTAGEREEAGQTLMSVAPERTTSRVLHGPFVDRGYFSISFTITADKETLYISRDPALAVRAFLLGGRNSELAPSADQQRITLRSNAPRVNDMYRIDKGTTRRFTLANTFTPRDAGTWPYWYELGYVLSSTEPNGIVYEFALPSRDEFQTDSVELSVHERIGLRDLVRKYMQERRNATNASR